MTLLVLAASTLPIGRRRSAERSATRRNAGRNLGQTPGQLQRIGDAIAVGGILRLTYRQTT